MTRDIDDILLREIVACVGAELDLSQYQLFLFGSRATGHARESSDIDVGVKGEAPLSFETLARIKNRLDELDTLYTIDFVDCTDVSEDFAQVALAHTIPLTNESHVKT